MDVKTAAEALRLGILVGAASVQDAVQWADQVIRDDDDPCDAVIEIALAGRRSRPEVLRMLQDVPGTVGPNEPARAALARMYDSLDADPSRGPQLARALYILATKDELPEDEFGLEPYALDDDFHLAEVGVLSEEEALQRLRRYLARHARLESHDES
jgi:hypothetical protein